MRAGDRFPVLPRTLEVDGYPVDLTGAVSVVFKAQGASGLVINAACDIVEPTLGMVEYAWTSQDALVAAGMYQAWFVVDYGAGVVLTVPNGSYLTLHLTSLGTGSWTYTGNPAASTRDAVRFYLQDTDPADPQMSDYELDFLIDEWFEHTGSPIHVASIAAETLVARYAREVTVSADAVVVAVEQLMDRYAALSERLKALYASKEISGPEAGAVDANETPDPSIKPLSFGKGMHDNRWAGRQDYAGDDVPEISSPLYGDPGGWW
jgi:hypothetical protein